MEGICDNPNGHDEMEDAPDYPEAIMLVPVEGEEHCLCRECVNNALWSMFLDA